MVADDGAIAIRADAEGITSYEFYETKDDAPTIVALASKVLAHVALGIVKEPSAAEDVGASEHSRAFRILIEHYEASFGKAKTQALEVTDSQPVGVA